MRDFLNVRLPTLPASPDGMTNDICLEIYRISNGDDDEAAAMFVDKPRHAAKYWDWRSNVEDIRLTLAQKGNEDVTESLVKQLSLKNVYRDVPLNDLGASELFSSIFAGKHRFNATAGQWFVYDGGRWKVDDAAMSARSSCKNLWRALRKYAYTLRDPDDNRIKAFDKWVGSWGTARFRNSVVNDARDDNFFVATDLDRDDFILNCRNGIIMLDNGSADFQPHRPGLLLSKQANVNFAEGVVSKRWIQFVGEIFEGDEEKIAYCQKLFGLCLVGKALEERMTFFFGETTRNGKSTALETIAYLLGDYAASIRPESLATRNSYDGSRASGDIARLAGIRLVVCSEIPKHMPLDVSLVKTLTGGDIVTARHLHQSEFQFLPKFKLICNTNHLPEIRDPTIFQSGRIHIVRFDRHFEESEQDKGLKERFKDEAELSGILNWCIRGWEAYQDEGLEMTAKMSCAVKAYSLESDTVQRFLDETIEAGNGILQIKDVYAKFVTWCEANGHKAGSKQSFIRDIKSKKLYGERGSVGGRQVRNVIPGFVFIDGLGGGFMEVRHGEEIPFD